MMKTQPCGRCGKAVVATVTTGNKPVQLDPLTPVYVAVVWRRTPDGHEVDTVMQMSAAMVPHPPACVAASENGSAAARQARLEIADFIEKCGRADSPYLAGVRANIVAAIRGRKTSLEDEPNEPVGQDRTPRN